MKAFLKANLVKIADLIQEQLSRNIDLHLNNIASQRSAEYIYKNLQTAISFDSTTSIHDFSISQLQDNSDEKKLCMEFGVYRGKTINFFAKKLPLITFHGFDSFKGLPEFWRPGYDEGKFSTDISKLKFEPNVVLHPGWFDESIPAFKIDAPKIDFLHIDCDLYSSTKIIFDCLGDKIQAGTLILFDEYFNYPFWENHEHKAFKEFVESRKLTYTYLGYVKNHEQVLLRID